MSSSRQFRDMKSAPMDGRSIEIIQGLRQEVVRAFWAVKQQGWVRYDEPSRRVLTWVTGWRPVK